MHLRKRSPGITFQNPQGTLVCNPIGEAYVDDTELWFTMQDKDITQLATEMQEIAQHWEQLLLYYRWGSSSGKVLLCGHGVSFPNDEHTLCQPSMMATSISLWHQGTTTKIELPLYRVVHQRPDVMPWVHGWLQMEIMQQTSELSAVKAKLWAPTLQLPTYSVQGGEHCIQNDALSSNEILSE